MLTNDAQNSQEPSRDSPSPAYVPLRRPTLVNGLGLSRELSSNFIPSTNLPSDHSNDLNTRLPGLHSDSSHVINLQQKCLQKDYTILQLRNDIVQLQQRMQQMTEQHCLHSSLDSELTQKLMKLENEVSMKRMEVTAMQKQLSKLQNSSPDGSAVNLFECKRDCNAAKLEIENKELQKEKEELKSLWNDMNKELALKDKKINALSQSTELYRRETLEKTKKLTLLTAELKKLKQNKSVNSDEHENVLKQEIIRLSQQYEAVSATLQEKDLTLREKQYEIKALQEYVNEVTANLQEKDKLLNESRKALDQLKSQFEHQREIIKNQESIIERNQEMVRALDNHNEQLQMELKESKEKYNNFRTSLAHLALEVPLLGDLLQEENFLKNFGTLIENYNKSQIESSFLHEEVTNKDKVFAQLHRELSSVLDTLIKIQVDLSEFRLSDVSENLQKLQLMDISGIGQELVIGIFNILSQQLSWLQELETTLQKYVTGNRIKMKDLGLYILELQLQIETLQSEKDFALSEMESQRAQYAENLHLKNNNFQELLEKEKSKFENITSENKHHFYQTMNELKESHSKELKEQQQELEFKHEHEKLILIDKANKEKENFQKTIEDIQIKKSKEKQLMEQELKIKIHKLQAETDNLSQYLSEKEEVLLKSKNELKDALKQINELKASSAMIKGEQHTLLITSNMRIDELREKLDCVKEDLEVEHLKNADLSERLTRLENEFQQKEILWEERKKKWEEETEKLKDVICEQKQSIEKLEYEYEKQQGEFSDLQKQLYELNEDAELLSIQDQTQQLIAALRHENAEYLKQIQIDQEVILGLRRDIAGTQVFLSNNQQKKTLGMKNKIKDQSEELSKQRVQLSKLSNITEQQSSQVKQLTVEASTLKSLSNKLEDSLKEKTQQISVLEKNLIEKEDVRQKLEKIIETLQKPSERQCRLELIELGKQCHGARHLHIIESQRDALKQLRIKLKNLQQNKTSGSSDENQQKYSLLKRELNELKYKKSQLSSSQRSSLKGSLESLQSDGGFQQTANILEMLEKCFLYFVNKLLLILNCNNEFPSLKSLIDLTAEQQEKILVERKNTVNIICKKIKQLQGKADKTEDLLKEYEDHSLRLKKTEELLSEKSVEVEKLKRELNTYREETTKWINDTSEEQVMNEENEMSIVPKHCYSPSIKEDDDDGEALSHSILTTPVDDEEEKSIGNAE